MIDRRTFTVGAGLAAVTTTTAASLAQILPPATDARPLVFAIHGWSVQETNGSDDQVWVKVGYGWRIAWR
jgi:hypothetical protein